MARPTKLTPEIQAKILGYVKAGNFLQTACLASGIDVRTLRNWVAKGRGNDGTNGRARVAPVPVYAAFLAELEMAEAEAEVAFVAVLNRAALGEVKGDWKAKAFLAERRLAKRWGQKVRLQVDSAISEFMQHLKARLDPDTFQRVVDATQDWGDRAEDIGAAGLAAEFAGLDLSGDEATG
jgi:transposase